MMRFRPCIDLHDGKVKQIVGGTLDRTEKPRTNFVSEFGAAHYAAMYRRDGLTGGHVIQLGSGNEQAACEALAAYPGGLQIGGGVTAENAQLWLDRGAAAVIVTSYVFCGGEFRQDRLDELLKAVGKERLVLDLSCRRRGDGYYIVTDRWQCFTQMKLEPSVFELLSRQAGEFLIHAVDVEGKQGGIDTELLGLMAEYSPIPVVYAGGIASFDDIRKIGEAGKGRVDFTIGSALDIFGGKMPYNQVLDACFALAKKDFV